MSLYADLTKLLQQYGELEGKDNEELDHGPNNQTLNANGHDLNVDGQEDEAHEMSGSIVNSGESAGDVNEEQSTETKDEKKNELMEIMRTIRDSLYGPAAVPEDKDPVEEFLNRPDGPLVRYGLVEREENNG